MKTLLPWLVKEREFRRYLGRALDACRRGRVILFYHRYHDQDTPTLIALAPEEHWERRSALARASFAAGRYRRVILANLPPIKRPNSR